MLLTGSDSFSQSSASSLGSWENISTSELVRLASTQGIKAPVHGRGGIRAVNGIRQGLIGHNAPAMPLVCHDHSGYSGGYGGRYGLLAGHGKEDVTCKVSEHPFTNLTPRSDIDEKLSLDDFLVVEMFINEGS